MNEPLLAAGVVAFTVGLVAAFAGSRFRPRIVGLGLMAAGALVALIAADPGSGGTWWMAAGGAATLAGLVWFAAALARWTGAAPGDDPGHPPTLDSGPDQ